MSLRFTSNGYIECDRSLGFLSGDLGLVFGVKTSWLRVSRPLWAGKWSFYWFSLVPLWLLSDLPLFLHRFSLFPAGLWYQMTTYWGLVGTQRRGQSQPNTQSSVWLSCDTGNRVKTPFTSMSLFNSVIFLGGWSLLVDSPWKVSLFETRP